ncbi:MAG: class I SAM-dependent RNA methyltransferase [Candidatus Schekmanbacteria bacterium]|nr:class I SAM-dependent RNA methyltransferase [Candidatus Schekmanbacteria bacterium]
MQKNKIIITCARNIETFLKSELAVLGFPVINTAIAHVETEGTMDDTMTFNFHLRTAHRVLFLISEFTAEDPDELYRKLFKLDWEKYIFEDGYISITSSVDNPYIKDSRFANLKCKDAIVDRINRKSGQRPDSGPLRDRAVIHLYWKENECAVYLDTSGESLSKRGYRKIPLKAPMQETLASAVLMAAGWKGDGNFVNPMCGSGTLAIEAALIALNRAPGLLRNNYGFMHIKGFNEKLWNELRKKGKAGSLKTLKGKIIATDKDRQAVNAAKNNAETAGVAHLIDFDVCDYADTHLPEVSKDSRGMVIFNPEYGERLGDINKLEAVYEGMGDFLKQKCKGYMGYIFTGNMELAKKIGLRAKRRIPFFNSTIECRLLEYELYEGSRDTKKVK